MVIRRRGEALFLLPRHLRRHAEEQGVGGGAGGAQDGGLLPGRPLVLGSQVASS